MCKLTRKWGNSITKYVSAILSGQKYWDCNSTRGQALSCTGWFEKKYVVYLWKIIFNNKINKKSLQNLYVIFV